MELLYFGTYEQVLYPYVKHNLRAEDRVQNETAFVEHLLLAADEEGNEKALREALCIWQHVDSNELEI